MSDNPTQQLAEDLRLINQFTDLEMIEVEQVDQSFNKAEGIQVVKYKSTYDDRDPENINVSNIDYRVTGGTLLFVNNPYPNRKPVGTGRVLYLVNDNKPTPENSLSGEKVGWNLEFLASHREENLFVIIDKKWDKIVEERYLAIRKTKELFPGTKHVFDKRYNVRGVGTEADKVRIEVEQPQSVQQLIAGFQAERQEWKKVIDSLESKIQELTPAKPAVKSSTQRKGKPRGKPFVKKTPVVETDIQSNFAE